MKTILMITCLFSLSAFAAEYKVLDMNANYGLAAMIDINFGTNAELGRAWIEVTETHNYGEGSETDMTRKQLKGLSFDAATETVNMESEGRIVACAKYNVHGRSIFRRKVLELTDACRFDKRLETVTVDDGYEISEQKRLKYFLVVE